MNKDAKTLQVIDYVHHRSGETLMIKNKSELEMLQHDKKQSKVKMYRQVIRCFLYASMKAYERVQRRKMKPKIESCIVEWAVAKFHEYEDAKRMEASVFNAFV